MHQTEDDWAFLMSSPALHSPALKQQPAQNALAVAVLYSSWDSLVEQVGLANMAVKLTCLNFGMDCKYDNAMDVGIMTRNAVISRSRSLGDDDRRRPAAERSDGQESRLES